MHEDETTRLDELNENTGSQSRDSSTDSAQDTQSTGTEPEDKQAAERFHRDFYESLDQNEQIGDENLMAESESDLGSTTNNGAEGTTGQKSPTNNESADNDWSSKA